MQLRTVLCAIQHKMCSCARGGGATPGMETVVYALRMRQRTDMEDYVRRSLLLGGRGGNGTGVM